MKIGIVTWFHHINYGTALQAYALQEFLRSNDYDCTLINYIPPIKRSLIQKLTYGNFKNRILDKIESYCFKTLKSDVKEKRKQRNHKFENFISENISFTHKIQTHDELIKLNNLMDCFICGSDQIWNPTNLNGYYYLNFVNNNVKKISYAPSFGVNNITETKQRKIKQWVNKFDKVSVREEAGVAFLSTQIKKDIKVVVDPTLLLNKAKWEEVLVPPCIKEEYILCYFLGERKEYWEVVDKLNSMTNYKVVVIPKKFKSYLKKYDLRVSTGPKEFIGLIKNARLILTDSYHGTIFSLIFEKDFFSFKRFSDKDKGSQNSRIYNILKLLNLEDRLVNNSTFQNNINNFSIKNYKHINKKLNVKIEESISFLLKSIND